MALVSLGGVLDYPQWPRGMFDVNTLPSSNTYNSATDTGAWVFTALTAGTIDRLHFRMGTNTGAQALRIAIQGITSAGFPDNVDTHFRVYNTTGSDDNTFVSSGLITDDGTDTGAKKTVSVGDQFCIRFSLPGWTTGQVAINYLADGADQIERTMVFLSNNTSTTTSSHRLDGSACGAIEYDDGSFPFFPNLSPLDQFTNHTLDDADTPDEYALNIQVPFACRATGVFIKASSKVNVDVNLYSAGGSVLAGPMDGGDCIELSSQLDIRKYYFPTPVELSAATVYRIGWKPPASPTTAIIWSTSLSVAGIRNAMNNGLNMQMSTRVDSGSWTDSTTDLIVAGFILDQVDDGAGGGGGSCALTNGTAVIPATCPV